MPRWLPPVGPATLVLMDRAQFIRQQTGAANEKFALTSGEEGARERFLQLAIDTYDFLISAGADFVLEFDPWPESAGNPLRHSGWGKRRTALGKQDGDRRIELSLGLIQRWESWNREYFEMRVRNPRLELRDKMQDISESHDASSWPAGYERRIQSWVDAGDPSTPPPFDDRHKIVNLEFFNRLRKLRQLCGGWLYWSADLGRIAFAPEPEWQRVRAAQELADAKWRREWEESNARSERMGRRLSEVMSIARSDNTFWQALRTWELEREAKRPSELPHPKPLTGPIRLVALSPEQQVKADNPPVDPIFAEFIARVREPDDALSVRDIVLNLRGEMRRELGLDHVIGWPDGPGIGIG
jgi:hypothetical protein